MHSNADIPDSQLTNYEQWLLSLNQTMNADPDQLYCRLMLSPQAGSPDGLYRLPGTGL